LIDHPHFVALFNALKREEAHQRAELSHAAKQPLRTRVELGVSWPILEVVDTQRRGNRGTWVTLSLSSRSLLHDGIEAGDTVELRPAGSPGPGLPGRVTDVQDHQVIVRTPNLFRDTRSQEITLRFDPSTFQRYAAALHIANGLESPLKDALLAERPVQPPVDVQRDCDDTLNASQRQAVACALTDRPLHLIHGPPGTGKTEVIAALLQRLCARGERPWALADSNAAVDHLAIRAASTGLSVVRVGHPGRISEGAADLSVDARIRTGPHGPALASIERELSRLWSAEDPASRRKRSSCIKERKALRDQAREHVLSSADVIACTLGTLARIGATLPSAPLAVVDEATQAMEPAIWVVAAYVQRLVLVGDPHQLGPVVTDPGNPLELSLFQRLVQQWPPGQAPVSVLHTQYRMHASIQALVQDVYGPEYSAHPSVSKHRLNDLAGVEPTLLSKRPVLWIDTAGADFEESFDPATYSLFNAREADWICQMAAILRSSGLPASDIGIIAPYSAQVARLRARPELKGIDIATVNAFQGSEKEAILCSFVRSNSQAEVGFVGDIRRLTVALTRARRFLLCIGDSSTLATASRFHDVLELLDAQGAWTTVWDEEWTD